MDEKRQEAEASILQRMAKAIKKELDVIVKWIPQNSGQLGYTSGVRGTKKSVHIAWYEHTYFNLLSEDERSMFRMGVFFHEMLHQLMTNFYETNKMVRGMTRSEAAIFMHFANTLEDPAIEYHAPHFFNGRALDSLRFSIRHIFKMSPPISESKTPFSQLINALVNFGDLGFVKGKFTFPEAKECFEQIAPLYDEGIRCIDSKKRLLIAKECMEIARPLWEEEIKNEEAMKELIKKLIEALEKNGAPLFSPETDDSSGDPADSSEDEDGDEVAKRRKDAIRKMLSRKSGGNSDNDDSNDNDLNGKDSDSEDSDGGSSDDEDNAKKCEASSANEENSTGTCSDRKDAEGGESSKSPETDDSSGDPADSSEDEDDGYSVPEDRANEIAAETFEINEDEAREIGRSIERESKALEKERESDGESQVSDFDINITGKCREKASCKNVKIKNDSGSLTPLYNKEVSDHAKEIKTLTKQLERIFNSDVGENRRTTSGSYNIKRGSIGTTARIFDKRKEKSNIKDISVVLAIDCSGSMGGSKIAQARHTAVVLAEALSANSIPYSIFGFSADRSADADHEHYVGWSGKRRERETLMALTAHGNNFDGYSIRYAGEMLKTRPTKNKLLFVISDGEPACSTYRGMRDGVSDTVNAIKEVRKYCDVFGIAIGRGCSPQILQSMYGRDFIYCQDENLLAATMAKKLTKCIKRNK